MELERQLRGRQDRRSKNIRSVPFNVFQFPSILFNYFQVKLLIANGH